MRRMSGLQLSIMRVLWQRGPSSVAEVQKELHSTRPLAYSTLATLLKRMEEKHAVRHITEGRTFIYEAMIQPEEAGHSLFADLLEHVFAGSPSQLVSHLLHTREIEPDEMARIESLVRKHQERTGAESTDDESMRDKSPRRSRRKDK